jgi:uncharacterized protein YndB with AHSA1/START domain
MGTLSFVTTVDIPQPPHVVWPFLVDWERLDRWMKEARDFQVVGAQRSGVGVEAEATVRIAGFTTRDRIRVTRWQPPEVLELAHLGWVKGTGSMRLSPTAQGSHLWWREELVPPWGPLGWLGMKLVGPVIGRTFRRDLELLRTLVDRES